MIKHPLYPNGNIYLSGGMQFADGLGAGWRQVVGERIKSMGYFPIDIADLDIKYANAHGVGRDSGVWQCAAERDFERTELHGVGCEPDGESGADAAGGI